MSERKYQKELLKSNKKVVFCNWSRNSGKTTAAIKLILNEKEEHYSYFGSSYQYVIDELRKQNNVEVKISTPRGILLNIDGDKIDIDIYKNDNIMNKIRGTMNLGICIFDEYIPSSQEVRYLYQCGAKRIIVLTTIEDFEYISDKNNDEEMIDFINKQIIELMNEYSEIPKYQSTTMTREKILSQIKSFYFLKERMEIKK